MRIFWTYVVLLGMISGMLFYEDSFIKSVIIGLAGLAGVWSWGRPLKDYLHKREE
ncbi:hypothetical protein SFC66_09245 [Terribacillus saccharophilus]|uniref:hypothetical protein n=1 Tax=Terribacillus saccharophilus TaxID=361277 RepID=UPI003982AF7A